MADVSDDVNVIDGTTFVVAPELPVDPVLEERIKDLDNLDASIKKTMEAMTEIEHNGVLIQQIDQAKRGALADKIQSQIDAIEAEKIMLADLAIKADKANGLNITQQALQDKIEKLARSEEFESFEEKKRKLEEVQNELSVTVDQLNAYSKVIFEKCVKTISYEIQETSLEETINGWFNRLLKTSFVDDILDELFPKATVRSIYLAYKDWFDERDWRRIVMVLRNIEVAMHSLVKEKLEVRVLVLRTVGVKEGVLPSQPNAAQLRALMKNLEEMGNQRAELEKEIAKRQAENAARATAAAAATVQPGQPGERVVPPPPGPSGPQPSPTGTPPVPPGPGPIPTAGMAERERLRQRYAEIIAARNPGLSAEEVAARSSQMVDKIMERRDQLIGQWQERIFSQGNISREGARDQAEKFVDLQLAADEKTALARTGGPVTGREMVAISQRPQVREEKVLKGEITVAQRKSREMLLRRAELNKGTMTWTDIRRDPSIVIRRVANFIKGYWNKFFGGKKEAVPGQGIAAKVGGAVVQKAEEKAKKAVAETAKKAAVGVAKQTVLSGLLAAVPTGVTQVVAALGVVKKIAGLLYDKIVPEDIREFIANLWSKMKIGLQAAIAFFLTHPLALAAAVLGGLIVGPLGFVAGFVVGLVAEGMVAGLVGASSGFLTGVSGGFAGLGGSVAGLAPGTIIGTITQSAVVTGIGGLAGGTGLASALFWTVAISIPGLGLISLILVLLGIGGVAVIDPANVQGQTRQALFSLTKSTVDTSLHNYNGSLTTVTYTINMQSTGDNSIKIISIKDKLSRVQGATSVGVGEINVPVPTEEIPAKTSKQLSYQFSFSGPEYDKSTLLNSVTVVAEDTVTKTQETQNGSIAIRINEPPADQPYGYPAKGSVTSLDLDSGGQVHWSCFFIFHPCRAVDGGIDIAGPGGTPVYSTMEGTVLLAQFRSDVGGVVYIQNGIYIAEYEHLENPSVTTGQTVTRGMQIGVTYTGKLPATRGVHPEHVHYQVVVRTGDVLSNIPFADSNNWGLCSQGKILPGPPGNTISNTGPFDCQ